MVSEYLTTEKKDKMIGYWLISQTFLFVLILEEEEIRLFCDFAYDC